MEISIRMISAGETYPLRQLVLRPGRPLEEVHFPGDEDRGSFHLGAFAEERLVAITSFMKNPHGHFAEECQYQMRGMAVLPEMQGQKIGQQLLRAGEKLLREENPAPLLWFNARESAEGFYRKNGYSSQGGYFEIPGVCTHLVMYKRL